jgi:CheY-like chemotaxis protein
MKKILIVEDDARFASIMGELLRTVRRIFGSSVSLEFVGSRAAMLTRLPDADVIVYDLVLPDSNKEESLVWVHENATTLPPMIALSGFQDDETRRQCLAAGFVDFLSKDLFVMSPPEAFFERCYNATIRHRFPVNGNPQET